MMAGVEQAWPEQTRIEDLPVYLTEPPPVEHFELRRLVGTWSGAYRAAAGRSEKPRSPSGPLEGRPAGTIGDPRPAGRSPVFDCMVPLERQRVAAVLDAWWSGGSKTGVIRVQRRLQLWPPEGDLRSGWEMRGRMRRLTSLHWVPVIVELWGKYDGFMRITVTPQTRVLTSRRYFRLGNSIVDRLWGDLAKTPVDPDGATP
jgi:hypothetical protein